MKDCLTTVKSVLPGSIAEEAGIEPGDCIIAINNEKIKDIFDYRFLTANEELVLEVQKKDGELWEVEVEKDEYEDLGVEFRDSMIDEAHSCTNKCIFCFMDQMPQGLRDTLYFKDDDMRLSFLLGNYVTLTNVNDDELDRLIKYRMSPINVSVHTTNPDLRVFILKNRFAGDVMKKIKRLIEGGISVNCQIVLCRGINDGAELDRSIEDLASLYPGIGSISVVPVGITKYREGLCHLEPYDRESSEAVVSQVEGWQQRLIERWGSRVVYPADEFYILAERELPDYEYYEDFPQIENGVGLFAQLEHEFKEALEEVECGGGSPRNVSIATGVSAARYIREMADTLSKRVGNLNVKVYEIENDFFGEHVTVTGLLTGGDIAGQLEGKPLGEELLICRCMLKAGEELFLDDFTVDMLKERLQVKIGIVENNGKDFIEKILGKSI